MKQLRDQFVLETGVYRNGQKFIRFGRGREELVILPPLVDALYEVTAFPAYLQVLFWGLSQKFSIRIIGRRRNMPVGYLTQDMAEEYAETLRELGPSHIIGISLGGLIAQYLASHHPELVKKLILVVSAHRMGPEGLAAGRMWIRWARLGQWDKIYDSNLALSYQRTGGVLFMKTLKLTLLNYLKSKITSPDDFILSGEAAMLHDASSILSSIQAPTLVIGGEKDDIFPEYLVREMAGRIPNSKLLILNQGRHAVYDEYTRQIDEAIVEFVCEPTRSIPLRDTLRRPCEAPRFAHPLT